MSDLLTPREVAERLRVSTDTVYRRVHDRTRPDAFPLDAIDMGAGRIRIHASVLPQPVSRPTPIRPADLPYGRRDDTEDRVARLVAKIRELQTAHLELATENLRLRQELDLLRIERRSA